MNGATDVGARVRQARESIGMTQQEVGTALGCTKGQVSRIETGARSLSVDELVVVSRILGKAAGWFFRSEGSPDPGPRPAKRLLQEATASLDKIQVEQVRLLGQVGMGCEELKTRMKDREFALEYILVPGVALVTAEEEGLFALTVPNGAEGIMPAHGGSYVVVDPERKVGTGSACVVCRKGLAMLERRREGEEEEEEGCEVLGRAIAMGRWIELT